MIENNPDADAFYFATVHSYMWHTAIVVAKVRTIFCNLFANRRNQMIRILMIAKYALGGEWMAVELQYVALTRLYTIGKGSTSHLPGNMPANAGMHLKST